MNTYKFHEKFMGRLFQSVECKGGALSYCQSDMLAIESEVLLYSETFYLKNPLSPRMKGHNCGYM
jgi:hypothetical protein